MTAGATKALVMTLTAKTAPAGSREKAQVSIGMGSEPGSEVTIFFPRALIVTATATVAMGVILTAKTVPASARKKA